MKPEWVTRDPERLPQDGGTISRSVRRVIDAWRARPTDVFGAIADELCNRCPAVLGRLDDESLDVLLSAVWLYLGGGKCVNKISLLAWFDRSLGGDGPQTTRIAYLNRNGQINIRPLNIPGTDHGQSLYHLARTHCGHNYAANGSDIHLRTCPNCQNGRPSTGGWSLEHRIR